ncbi:MAG: tannase/feruloyl esterase family alpha/beta hydrolase [Actinomycetota bacterium]|nr:tannase/feruloyl esterase family alpha/beta hydrolase [Actinomycetota bacterium]
MLKIVAGLALLVAAALFAAPAHAQILPTGEPPGQVGGGPRFGPRCAEGEKLKVPGAEVQLKSCLGDLTTAGTQRSGHTNTQDFQSLNAEGTRNPTGVRGIQVDGFFPDDSRSNTNNGFNHDSQYVIRLPEKWNGKLVMSGAPGVRRQYANDFIISDYVLSLGYAFASTDKGNTGLSFFRDGKEPGDAILEWHRRVRELTVATKDVIRQRYGREPERTYITGISNGGYLTRWALEKDPELYDGGVDWEGTLFRAEGPNLLTYLPPTLRNYPRFAATGDQGSRQRILDAGFFPGSEFLWDEHYTTFWDLTQRIFREEFDPGYDGSMEAGIPFCQQGTPNCDANYDYASRPQSVKDAVGKVSLNGTIGKPLLSLHGDLDTLLPIRRDGAVYERLIGEAGRAPMHRFYTIERGNHIDAFYNGRERDLRPILPCQRATFLALDRWVEGGKTPPPTQSVPKPGQGDVVNSCALAGETEGGEPAGERPSSPSPSSPGPSSPGTPSRFEAAPAQPRRRVAPRGLQARVTPGRDRRAPYRFRTTGRLSLPQGTSRAQGCRGLVTVQVKAGRRTVSTRRARLRPDCTFRSSVSFAALRRLGRGRLKFTARFQGNGALTAARARSRSARAR